MDVLAALMGNYHSLLLCITGYHGNCFAADAATDGPGGRIFFRVRYVVLSSSLEICICPVYYNDISITIGLIFRG